VVTGISGEDGVWCDVWVEKLQWGPVVVTGISAPDEEELQRRITGFNGVRSW